MAVNMYHRGGTNPSSSPPFDESHPSGAVMKAQSQQEVVTLMIIVAFAALIFWETREFGGATNGQISPGAFPRLAAGTMGMIAVIRAVLLLTRVAQPSHSGVGQWAWATLKRPFGAAVLMTIYTAAFESVPFAPLTVAFVFSAFLIFGVRPWKRLLIGTAIASSFLYLLFVQLLNVGV